MDIVVFQITTPNENLFVTLKEDNKLEIGLEVKQCSTTNATSSS